MKKLYEVHDRGSARSRLSKWFHSSYLMLRESAWSSVALKMVFLTAAFTGLGWLGSDEVQARFEASPAAEGSAIGAPVAAGIASGAVSRPRLHQAAKPPPVCNGPTCGASASKGVTPDGRVVLNEATIPELTRLPGVGEARAKAIAELREQIGKFRRVEDLLRVRGIGHKSLARMKPMLVLDPIEPAPAEHAP